MILSPECLLCLLTHDGLTLKSKKGVFFLGSIPDLTWASSLCVLYLAFFKGFTKLGLGHLANEHYKEESLQTLALAHDLDIHSTFLRFSPSLSTERTHGEPYLPTSQAPFSLWGQFCVILGLFGFEGQVSLKNRVSPAWISVSLLFVGKIRYSSYWMTLSLVKMTCNHNVLITFLLQFINCLWRQFQRRNYKRFWAIEASQGSIFERLFIYMLKLKMCLEKTQIFLLKIIEHLL